VGRASGNAGAGLAVVGGGDRPRHCRRAHVKHRSLNRKRGACNKVKCGTWYNEVVNAEAKPRPKSFCKQEFVYRRTKNIPFMRDVFYLQISVNQDYPPPPQRGPALQRW